MLVVDPRQRYLFAGNGSSDQKCTSFDPVRNHFVFSAVQLFDALNHNSRSAGSLDSSAHLVQEVREVDNLRLTGCVLDYGSSFGQDACHQNIIRSQNRAAELAFQRNLGPDELGREYLHVAPMDPNRSSQCFESAEVQIDRSISDYAASRQRNRGFFLPAKQRTEDAN